VSDRPNLFSPSFEPPEDTEGFRALRARVGRQAGCEGLGASVYELPPGEAICPYHFHLANEEMLVVVSGRPSLRVVDGWRELMPGDVVAFPAGPEGAHQVVNRSPEPARVLAIGEMNAPEVVVYPDSRKVGTFERPPGSGEPGLQRFLPEDAAVGFWEGEEAPGG
jgi:uncharacterized cupin superfamily protein